MNTVLVWSYYIIVPFVAAAVTLLVWKRHQIATFAVIAGTLAGAALSLATSALYWSDVKPYQSYVGEAVN